MTIRIEEHLGRRKDSQEAEQDGKQEALGKKKPCRKSSKLSWVELKVVRI